MAPSSKSRGPYEVFLSFRGMDVRKNFVGHLYNELVRNGIHTFRDSEELWKGDKISMLMQAIKESRIAIIVFSENYAFSWWCLEEVANIMECKEQNDLIVLPVFYKADPKEVRGGRASYARGLAKHESKHPEKMERWKKALWDAGHLIGWTLNDGDDESNVLQKIVKNISTRLSQTPLDVAEHPVGIESRVAKLKSMLNLESKDDVLMVGLWGQGGIGKTTLGKAINNDISGQFDGSSFLAGVRENSEDRKGLVTLQEQLLNDILLPHKKIVVPNVDRGVMLIQDRLRNKRVLIILDDVDHEKQLLALARKAEWFGNGSRILVTTRDGHLLTRWIDEHHVYEVKALDNGEARELLSKHAFPPHHKLKIREDLVDGVLDHAKGLPLALVVLGSFLCGRRQDEWESALDKLSRSPTKDINDVLKISYEGLERNEKEIFLHIACFFKGWDFDHVKKVLDSCDLNAVIGLQILTERSLIRTKSGSIQVHDLIQLMGKDIVNQESDDPERRSRLWLYEDVLDVLSCDMGDCNVKVKAIVLNSLVPIEISTGRDAFTKLRGLELLILGNVSFQGPMCLPNRLRWFEWPDAPWIPEFSSGPNKLRGLDMRGGTMTTVPKPLGDFRNLKYMNFDFCKSLVRTPDISWTPNLEELHLNFCKNLVEVHVSIGDHGKLQVLDLRNCSELRIFPKVLEAKNLRELQLGKCTKLERFPDVPRKLEGLIELDLEETAIKGLPASIENLVSLEEINLDKCKNLVSLPSSIYKLQNLRALGAECCTNLIGFPKFEDSNDPCMKTGLSNLLFLYLYDCNLTEVEFLENLSCCPILEELHLGRNNINSLPTSISKRDHLLYLTFSECPQLREIPELPLSLGRIEVDNSESLQKSDSTLIHHFVRRGLAMADISSRDQVPRDLDISLMGGEMPEWVVPVEEGFVSFKASKDLYDKFLGLAFSFAVHEREDRMTPANFEIFSYVEGEGRYFRGDPSFHVDVPDYDYTWIQYFVPSDLWGVVDFGQIDGNYVQFSLSVSTTYVKKWGLRIICKPLEDDLKAALQNNQLMDPALLLEVVLKSIDSEVESKVSSIKIDLLKDMEDGRMSSEEHSRIESKRNQEFILPQGKRMKTLSTSNSTDGDEKAFVD